VVLLIYLPSPQTNKKRIKVWKIIGERKREHEIEIYKENGITDRSDQSQYHIKASPSLSMTTRSRHQGLLFRITFRIFTKVQAWGQCQMLPLDMYKYSFMLVWENFLYLWKSTVSFLWTEDTYANLVPKRQINAQTSFLFSETSLYQQLYSLKHKISTVLNMELFSKRNQSKNRRWLYIQCASAATSDCNTLCRDESHRDNFGESVETLSAVESQS